MQNHTIYTILRMKYKILGKKKNYIIRKKIYNELMKKGFNFNCRSNTKNIYIHCFKNRTGRSDRFNREPGASPVRLKASKPVNNRKTGQKPVKNRG